MTASLNSLIGKYINQYGYSDVNPIGKIIGIKGKSTLIVQTVKAMISSDWKPEWMPGGFSAICINNAHQRWEFTEEDHHIEIRYSKQFLKRHKVEDHPKSYYDYNF